MSKSYPMVFDGRSQARRYKDYHVELRRALKRRSTTRVCQRLNKCFGSSVATVIPGHPTLLRVRGVARKDLALALKNELEPFGSAYVARRRGEAGAWLVRPMANRLIMRL
jgi:hypothetical protein